METDQTNAERGAGKRGMAGSEEQGSAASGMEHMSRVDDEEKSERMAKFLKLYLEEKSSKELIRIVGVKPH